MNERPFGDALPSPNMQLANFYASLADDALEDFIEIDEETCQQAEHIIRAVSARVSSIGLNSDAVAKPGSSQISQKRVRSDQRTAGFPKSQRKENLLARMFGLHPGIAAALVMAALVFDFSLVGTLGFAAAVEVPLAPIFGSVVALMQARLYKDRLFPALLKGMAVALLLAIPNPFAPFVFVAAGISGLLWLRKKKIEEKR